MAQHLTVEKEAYFPKLHRDKYKVTSKDTPQYNCIAHAAGKDDRLWWPVDAIGVHWPDGVDKSETVDCFIRAYATQGYEPCDGGSHEIGFEKVAIYVDASGTPSHAARQLPNGSWTSKLGDWEDIEHSTLESLEDDTAGRGLGYGKVATVLKRRHHTDN